MDGERIAFDATGAQQAGQERIDFDPSDARPVRKVGLVDSIGRTVGAAAIPVVRAFDMAAAGLAGLLGATEAQQQIFRDADQRSATMREFYGPAADEDMSLPGQVVGGMASLPIEVVGGMGLQRGIERSADVVQRGGTLREAGVAGGTTGAVNLGLNLLPVKAGGRVAQKLESKLGGVLAGAATGAAINVPAQVAGTAAENLALPSREDATLTERAAGSGARPGFEDLARDPLDPQDLAVGTGLSAAFGGAAGAAARRSARQRQGRPAAGDRSSPSGQPVPLDFDEAVKAGQLQPAELSDAS